MNTSLLVWVAGLVPLSAVAQVQQDTLDPDKVHSSTWVWLMVFSLMGWLASDLPKLAGWIDRALNEGNILKTRLEIVQGALSSVFLGVGVYFIGKSYPKWLQLEANPPEMILFVFVGIAGYAGTRGLEWARNRFFKPPTP